MRGTDLRDKSRGLSPGKSVPRVPSTASAVKAEHSAVRPSRVLAHRDASGSYLKKAQSWGEEDQYRPCDCWAERM